MKTLITLAALAGAAVAASPAFADAGGSCHFHGAKAAPESTVVACANQRLATLVKAGKLDASWETIRHAKVETVDGKKGKEWKLSFSNPAAADKSKATLYMFFTPPGNFIAANFDGK